jgi:hypothetical protein
MSEKLPPALPSLQVQVKVWPGRESVAPPVRVVVLPEPTVLGLAEAVTVRVCVTGCTTSVAVAVLVSGLGPLQVALSVNVTVRSPSVVLAAAA